MARFFADYMFDLTARRATLSQDSQRRGGMDIVTPRPRKAASDPDGSTIRWKIRVCCSTALSAAAVAASCDLIINSWTSTGLHARSRSLRSQRGAGAKRENVAFALPDVWAFVQGARRLKPQLTWVSNPVLLPEEYDLEAMSQAQLEQRKHFWVSAFCVTHISILLTGTTIMLVGSRVKHKCCRRRKETQQNYASLLSTDLSGGPSTTFRSNDLESAEADKGNDLKITTGVLFSTVFSTSAGAVLYSWKTGRLSKTTGLDFEFYYGVYCVLGGSMLLQAFAAVAICPAWRYYPPLAFAEGSTFGMMPFTSDAQDTVKDVIFSGLCINSDKMFLKVTGVASLSYLFAIHMYFLRKDGHAYELAWSYVPVLVVQSQSPTETKKQQSIQGKGLVKVYQQTTPTKLDLQIKENLVQAVGALLYLWLEGGSAWVAAVGVAYPILQVSFGGLLYSILRRRPEVKSYLVNQYIDGVTEKNETKQNAMLDELDGKLTEEAMLFLLRSFCQKSKDHSVNISLLNVEKLAGGNVWDVPDSKKVRSYFEDDEEHCVTFEGELSADHCKLIGKVVHYSENLQRLKLRVDNRLSAASIRGDVNTETAELDGTSGIEQGEPGLLRSFLERGKDGLLLQNTELDVLPKIPNVKLGESGSILNYLPEPGPLNTEKLLVDYTGSEPAVTFHNILSEEDCVWIKNMVRKCKKVPRMRVKQQDPFTVNVENKLLDIFLTEFKERRDIIELSIDGPIKVEFNGSQLAPSDVKLVVDGKSFTEEKVVITTEMKDVAEWALAVLKCLKIQKDDRRLEEIRFDFVPEPVLAMTAKHSAGAKHVFIPGEELEFTEDWKDIYVDVLATRKAMKNIQPLRRVKSTFVSAPDPAQKFPSGRALDEAADAGATSWMCKGHNLLSVEMTMRHDSDVRDLLKLPRGSKCPLERVVYNYAQVPPPLRVEDGFRAGATDVIIPGEPLVFNRQWADDGIDERLYIKAVASRGNNRDRWPLVEVRSEFKPSVEALDAAVDAGVSKWIVPGREGRTYDVFEQEVVMIPETVEMLHLPRSTKRPLKILKLEVGHMDQAMSYFYPEAGILRDLEKVPLGFSFDGCHKQIKDPDLLILLEALPQNVINLEMKLTGSLVTSLCVKHIADTLPAAATVLSIHVSGTQGDYDEHLQYLAAKLPKRLTRVFLDLTSLKISPATLESLKAAGPQAQGAMEIRTEPQPPPPRGAGGRR